MPRTPRPPGAILSHIPACNSITVLPAAPRGATHLTALRAAAVGDADNGRAPYAEPKEELPLERSPPPLKDGGLAKEKAVTGTSRELREEVIRKSTTAGLTTACRGAVGVRGRQLGGSSFPIV